MDNQPPALRTPAADTGTAFVRGTHPKSLHRLEEPLAKL